MIVDYELSESLVEHIFEQLFPEEEAWDCSTIKVKYIVRLVDSSFDHSFGRENRYDTEFEIMFLRIETPKESGKELDIYFLNPKEMKERLSHTLYDKIIDQISAHSENYFINLMNESDRQESAKEDY